MSRRNFSKATLVARHEHAKGLCEWVDPETKIRCDAVLIPGRWHGDHDNPDGMTGEPTFENCRCLCLDHHRIKTKKDIADIAEAKRRKASHVGAKPEPEKKLQGPQFRSPEKRKAVHTGLPPLPRRSPYVTIGE